MTLVAILALAGAAASAGGQFMTKQLVDRLPVRPLIGALYALNALLLIPAAPFVDWHWSRDIALLHLASIAVMALSVLFIFDLFAHGSAGATTTALGLSPIPAAIATAAIGLGGVGPAQWVAAAVVALAVMLALPAAFAAMTRARALLAVAMAGFGHGMVTVLARLLADEGAGTVEIYVVRTSACALLFLALYPPRGIPRRTLPALTLRATLISAQFVLFIEAVRRGSPAVVQTLGATAPILTLAMEHVRPMRRPPARLVACAAMVVVAVALVVR